MGGIGCLIKNNLDDEREIFIKIFDLIEEEVLMYYFELTKASNDGKVIALSYYLKKDSNHYTDVFQIFFKIQH